jgi:hypothetical protein
VGDHRHDRTADAVGIEPERFGAPAIELKIGIQLHGTLRLVWAAEAA